MYSLCIDHLSKYQGSLHPSLCHYISSIIFPSPMGSLCGQFELEFCLIKCRIHKCVVVEECGNEEVCKMEEEQARERQETREKYHIAND